MFIITHDLEAALVCDKTAILREGRLLDFDTPENLIGKLPSDGLLARLTVNNLNQEKIDKIKKYDYCEKVARVGNNQLECFLEDFNANLERFIDYLLEQKIDLSSLTRDIANFRRYFQIRIQEEEEKERRLQRELEQERRERERKRQENLRTIQENSKKIEENFKKLSKIEDELNDVSTLEALISIKDDLGVIKVQISNLRMPEELALPAGEESQVDQYQSNYESTSEKLTYLLKRSEILEQKLKLTRELENRVIDSEKMKMDMLNEFFQRRFQISRTDFLSFIYDWTEQHNIKINGNLIFIKKNDIFNFITALNQELELWKPTYED